MSYQFYQWLNIKKFKIRFYGDGYRRFTPSDLRKRSIIVYHSDLQFAKIEACEKTDHNENEVIEVRRI